MIDREVVSVWLSYVVENWLYAFKEREADPVFDASVEALSRKTADGDQNAARHEIQDLLRTVESCCDSGKNAGIRLECAQVLFEFEQDGSARQMLIQARRHHVGPHDKSVTDWMLGCLHALDNLETAKRWFLLSREGFEIIFKRYTSSRHDKAASEWYQARCEEMNQVMAEMVTNERLVPPPGPAPRSRSTPSASPAAQPLPSGPVPQPSSPGPTQVTEEERLYRDLLAKTRGDRGTAERLIEHERQRSPQASRAELIRDAIRRWEHDNR